MNSVDTVLSVGRPVGPGAVIHEVFLCGYLEFVQSAKRLDPNCEGYVSIIEERGLLRSLSSYNLP